jgi:hypothetical protein
MMVSEREHLLYATLMAFISFCGADAFGQADQWPGEIEHHFRRLRASIQKDDGPAEVYALLSNATQRVIELNKDGAAVLHCDDGNGRTRERAVPAEEFAQLQHWLSANKVDEQQPYDEGAFDGVQYEYVHLDRRGTERRVPMNNPPGTIAAPAVLPTATPQAKRQTYGALTKRMRSLDAIPMRVSYQSLEHLPGFRLVYTADQDYVTALSVRQGQLLAAVRREGKQTTWHAVTDHGIAAERVVDPGDPLKREWWPRYSAEEYADATEGPYAGKRLWVGTRQKDQVEGLWASGVKGAPELVVRGRFGRPIICPGGEWVVAAKAAEGKMWDVPNTVVRIHLPTKKVTSVELTAADDFNPIAWLPSHRRVLLYQQRDDYRGGVAGPREREYYLLDPASGVCQRVTGDFRPLTDYNNLPRRLQPSSEANVVWAAVVDSKADQPDEADTDLGKYSMQNFIFSPLLHLPGVRVDSDQMVVDENARAAWLLLNGDIAKVALTISPAGPK